MIGDRNVTSEPTKKLSKRGHIESEDEGNNFMLSRNNDDTFMEDMYKELQTTDEEGGESPNVLGLKNTSKVNSSRKNSLNESINEYQKLHDSLDSAKLQ